MLTRKGPVANHSEVTVSIDPALHGLGVGLWRGTELVWGGYIPRPKGTDTRGPGAWLALSQALRTTLDGWTIDYVVVELMQFYKPGQGHAKRGAAEDLLELNGVSGACVGALHPRLGATGYLPAEWKGQVATTAMATRVRMHIDRHGWTQVVDWTGTKKDEDIAHGIGLGLHHLGIR